MEIQNKPQKVENNQPTVNQQDEGYSTIAKVGMVVGAIGLAVGFWWCGGVDVAKNMLEKVWKNAPTLEQLEKANEQIEKVKNIGKGAGVAGGAVVAVAGAAAGGVAAAAKGAEEVAQWHKGLDNDAQQLSEKFDEALKNAGGPTLKYEEDHLDKLISGLKPEDIQKIPSLPSGPHKIPRGNDHYPVIFIDNSNPFTTLAEVSKLFSAKNLENAVKAVQEAEIGKPFDVQFYEPMIDFLYEQDYFKYKPLKDKLREIKSSNIHPFEAFAALSRNSFSAENLECAVKAVQEAEIGKSFDVQFYRPMIDFLYGQDRVKFKPIHDKFGELERSNSMGGKVVDPLLEKASNAAAGFAGALAGNAINRWQNQGNNIINNTIQDPNNIREKQEKLDEEIKRQIQTEDCDHIVDINGFKKLAEDTFTRHPHFLILHQAQYDKCIEKIEKQSKNRT
ncbi:MAG TPA: hypothetical protein VLE96_05490 [Chlamydiales bacterium]|nr:hypothetical protein [Chlamydiales bacterium]